MVTQSKPDIYDRLTARMRYPGNKTLRKIFELLCTPEEAELIAELPTTATAATPDYTVDIAKKLNRKKEDVDAQLKDLWLRGIIGGRVKTPEVQRRYTFIDRIEGFSDQRLHVISSHTLNHETREIEDAVDREVCDLWQKFFIEDWYRWEKVDELVHSRGPGGALGWPRIAPAWQALEISDVDAPDWDLRALVRNAKAVHVLACSCKARARLCKDGPIWACVPFFEIEGKDQGAMQGYYEEKQAQGALKTMTPDEWLEEMGEAEKAGMIHLGSGLARLKSCTCCKDCCNAFDPLYREAKPSQGMHKAPFHSVVNEKLSEKLTGAQKRDIVSVCRFEAIRLSRDGNRDLVVDAEKCFGCGLCVVRSAVKGALKLQPVA